jgi:hypothetical protein
MKRYLLLPFHSTTLVLLGTFSFCWLLVFRAGFIAVPAALILASWFFKYCFVLFDSIVAGEREPPVLSIEMLNPLDELRPLSQAAVIAAAIVLVRALADYAGPRLALASAAVLLFALPASVAVLGMTHNPLRALWPPALWEIARSSGWHYSLTHIAIFAAGVLVYGLASLGAPLWLLLAGAQLWLLSAFSLIGGVIFEHRHALGLDVSTWQERQAEREQREQALERKRMLDRAYAKFRTGQPQQGFQEIQDWLERGPPGAERLQELSAAFESACAWEDVRCADQLAWDLIAALLASKETGKALGVLEKRLSSNPAFRPAPAYAARLAQLAAAAGKPALRRRLESDVGPGASL